MTVGLSERFIYDIIKMTVIINLSVVNMILLKRETVHIRVLIYNIIKMRDFVLVIVLSMLFLKLEMLYFCVIYI
jgi:hypothetical protein